jgi:hypothetical protein
MPAVQGSIALLDDPIAKELLCSKIPARLAYVWLDESLLPSSILQPFVMP